MYSDVYRSAYVYVQGKKAGVISENEEGYAFYYLPAYLMREDAVAVSLTLPLTIDPYISKVLFPFFDGLIPEGWLLNIVRTHWNIPEKDRFGVLINACKDCIGDVQVVKGEI
ncbi:HipA N-terminal domain-containing protein [Candidatus Saccharibacteria bacterium]|nr:HipA N-terminal domain-containing protein [Candidatus Saccharibacteria bacterium]